MFDAATIAALAASAVSLTSAFLQKGVEEGAKEAGKSLASAALAKLKSRLHRDAAVEAMDDLKAQPTDAAARGALEMQLRKAMAEDPHFAEYLQRWTKEHSSVVAHLSVDVRGDHNRVTQISGSGNIVG